MILQFPALTHFLSNPEAPQGVLQVIINDIHRVWMFQSALSRVDFIYQAVHIRISDNPMSENKMRQSGSILKAVRSTGS